jgi:hypothetical protein
VKRGWNRWTVDELVALNAAAFAHWRDIRSGSFLFAPADRAIVTVLKTQGSRVLIRMPGRPRIGLLATVSCYYSNLQFESAASMQHTRSRERFRALWDMYFGRARGRWLADRKPRVQGVGLDCVERNVIVGSDCNYLLGGP